MAYQRPRHNRRKIPQGHIPRLLCQISEIKRCTQATKCALDGVSWMTHDLHEQRLRKALCNVIKAKAICAGLLDQHLTTTNCGLPMKRGANSPTQPSPQSVTWNGVIRIPRVSSPPQRIDLIAGPCCESWKPAQDIAEHVGAGAWRTQNDDDLAILHNTTTLSGDSCLPSRPHNLLKRRMHSPYQHHRIVRFPLLRACIPGSYDSK